MGKWVRPAGGEFRNKSARGWSGYVKIRDDYTVKSAKVKQQNQRFREKAINCRGKNRADFLACMS